MKVAVFWAVAPCSQAASTSETSVKFYQTIRSNNPENSHLHSQSIFFNAIWTRTDSWRNAIQQKVTTLNQQHFRVVFSMQIQFSNTLFLK
jgi:hypothetical protein